MASASVLQTFNQQACDMLADLARVFPNDMWLAKATKLVNAAIAMNERSWLPAVAFMGGEPPERWDSFERSLFEIPQEHLTTLFTEASDANKDVIRRYMHNLATMCARLNQQAAELNTAVSSMRQGDAFGSIMGMIGELNDNPAQLITQLTSGDGGLGEIAEGLSQNADIANMVGEVASKVDMSKVAGLLPLLQGAVQPQ